jgi:cold shock CspA family protein
MHAAPAPLHYFYNLRRQPWPISGTSKAFLEIAFRHCEVSEEIYFHRNAVLDGAFDRLSIGSEVAFVEEEGEKGPRQALFG